MYKIRIFSVSCWFMVTFVSLTLLLQDCNTANNNTASTSNVVHKAMGANRHVTSKPKPAAKPVRKASVLKPNALVKSLPVNNTITTSKVFPGRKDIWYGYVRYSFKRKGKQCYVVCPKKPAGYNANVNGNPWIWRARFFGHEPQTDLALLAKGYYVAYSDVANMFGSPQAVAQWNDFYNYLTRNYGFAKKVVLEGMSRGGLIIFNWASANPDKVVCMYADAPVCDFKSWPLGQGKFAGNKGVWQQCLKAYGFNQSQALAYKHNPIETSTLEPLAKAVIPIIAVCGSADKIVPIDENILVVEKRYNKLGGLIKVIIKPGCGHHPHSLKNPAPIVNFITKYVSFKGVPYYTLRNSLHNSKIIFSHKKTARVAFLGGSITEMNGWRNFTAREIARRFPETKFDFINAGIASTDSTLGSFRLTTDVFKHSKVDLLFVEFAVNDEHHSSNFTHYIRGMEGIIRQARLKNPDIDIVMMYFVEPSEMEMYNAGKTPAVITAHEKVAEYYNISSINLAKQVTDSIKAGLFTWKKFGGVHPHSYGHRVYAKSIRSLLDAAWGKISAHDNTVIAYPLPAKPLDDKSYYHGRYVGIRRAKLVKGWKYVPKWKARQGQNRPRFRGIAVLEAVKPDAELKFNFTGTAVGIYELAGPDVGYIEYSIDNNPFRQLDQYTRWSYYLNIPWPYILDDNLQQGRHSLILRTAEKKNPQSHGYASTIIQFLVN